MRRIACLILPSIALLLAASGARADAVAAVTEQRIVEHIAAHEQDALDLLVRAVNINSGTMNFAGVYEVGQLFEAEFAALGFETRWLDGAAFGRAGHLMATRAGPGLKVLLIGHLDTVFEPDSPFQRFERLDATHARGPGATDMKGGNVIILRALAALLAAGVLDEVQITVVLTGDEEKPGDPLHLARAALIEAADAADVALGFEDGDGDPRTAVIARRGSSEWTLRVTGRPAHSSQIFREDIGPGAIFETARILEGFRVALSGERFLTFNPGLIVGGTGVGFDAGEARGTAFGKTNVIAEHAVVSGGIRTISPEQLTAAQARMQAIAGASLPHTVAEITFADGYPPLAPGAGNRRLLALYDQVSRDLGYGPVTAVDPGKAGAADVSFTSGRVEMALDGLGLMGEGGHTEHETADLATLSRQAQRAAVLIYRLARQYRENNTDEPAGATIGSGGYDENRPKRALPVRQRPEIQELLPEQQ